MITFESIKLGDKIEVCNPNDPDRMALSQVMDIDLEEKVILISKPTLRGRPFYMRSGEDYEICVYVGTKDVYQFQGVYLKSIIEDAYEYFAVKLLGYGQKSRRRTFFRFSCALAMKFSILDYGDNEAARALHDAGYTDIYEGIVRDISASGIRFVSNKDMDDRYLIQCNILMGSDTMRIKGKIIHKQDIPKSKFKFQYRVGFVDISPDEQDDIVNFIFLEQSRQKRESGMFT